MDLHYIKVVIQRMVNYWRLCVKMITFLCTTLICISFSFLSLTLSCLVVWINLLLLPPVIPHSEEGTIVNDARTNQIATWSAYSLLVQLVPSNSESKFVRIVRASGLCCLAFRRFFSKEHNGASLLHKLKLYVLVLHFLIEVRMNPCEYIFLLNVYAVKLSHDQYCMLSSYPKGRYPSIQYQCYVCNWLQLIMNH